MSTKPTLEPIRDNGLERCIVFLHGVLSNNEKGWTSKTGVYWPKLISKESEFDCFDIFAFNYPSNIWSGDYSIDDAAQLLRDDLTSQRFKNHKIIVFVCHSMGGIIARRCIVRSEIDFEGKSIGLFLVASPSLGSHYANYIAPLSKIVGHSQGQSLKSIESNHWLQSLDSDFFNVKERTKIKVFGKELIEHKLLASKKWVRFKQVVTYYSANRYFGDPLKIPESDHITISKPESKDSPQHKALCNFLTKVLHPASLNHSAAPSPELLEAQQKVAAIESLNNRILAALDYEFGKTLDNLVSLLLPAPHDKTDAQAKLLSSIGDLVKQGRLDTTLSKHAYEETKYIRLKIQASSPDQYARQQIDSTTWFTHIAEKLENCSYARIYLHSFDHPDDFQPKHKAQLERIINLLKSKISDGTDLKIISYRTYKQKTGVDWLKQQLSNSIKIEDSIVIKKTQSIPNTASMYVFGDRSVIYNTKSSGGASYYLQQFQDSIVHESMKVGIEQMFETAQ